MGIVIKHGYFSSIHTYISVHVL